MSRYLKILFWFVIVAVINTSLAIANLFIGNNFLRGFINGINFVIISTNIVIIIDRWLEKRKEKKLLEKCGFRKDFDWNTRFELKTQVGKYEVSTVDLGIDYNFFGDKPLYYETMIFLKGNTFEERHSEENPFEYYQERYTTEEEARKGHEEAIKYVKEHLKEENNE